MELPTVSPWKNPSPGNDSNGSLAVPTIIPDSSSVLGLPAGSFSWKSAMVGQVGREIVQGPAGVLSELQTEMPRVAKRSTPMSALVSGALITMVAYFVPAV